MSKHINGIQIATIKYLETHRGVAYVAPLLMDGMKIGTIENRGDGGMTNVYVDVEHRSEFNSRKNSYFQVQSIPIHEDGRDFEKFAEHLIDLYEFGRVLSDEEKLALLREED